MQLKEWRESTGRSGEALAAELECTRQAVSRYEKGRVPEPAIMRRIITVSRAMVTANDWFKEEIEGGRLL